MGYGSRWIQAKLATHKKGKKFLALKRWMFSLDKYSILQLLINYQYLNFLASKTWIRIWIYKKPDSMMRNRVTNKFENKTEWSPLKKTNYKTNLKIKLNEVHIKKLIIKLSHLSLSCPPCAFCASPQSAFLKT
jgi:hypothetical protein